ncbi:ankyrin repeat domain-containing protein [Blastomonas sp.]|uniref:ankyrin repeat domain-containing protein n=1 Tax=Blastomonas sp. TaxID=1909299 RepID=UPI0026065939|nr:ankyrin repeat domain-containing protein [Blastomonas sp.]MDM7956391.1 ankyrin repeat domain-containing protein [Blastomonas sp.]
MQPVTARFNTLTRLWIAAIAALAMLIPAAANAQFSESYNFLKAVRDRDGDKATSMLNEPGSTVVNTKDISTGETALHIVTARRDLTWMGFLLQRGANPNARDKNGVTPLMLATTLRFADGAQTLLERKARVDDTNNSGETALIRAVQLRDLALVRLLLREGANPDKQDTIAGQSARDYAKSDFRNPQILDAMTSNDKERTGSKTSPKVFGPTG